MTAPVQLPCIHDMHPADCAFCTKPPQPAAPFAQPSGPGPWITADYGSDCAGCGGPIGEGEQIRADGDGGWLCPECGSEDQQ